MCGHATYHGSGGTGSQGLRLEVRYLVARHHTLSNIAGGHAVRVTREYDSAGTQGGHSHAEDSVQPEDTAQRRGERVDSEDGGE